MFSQNIEIRWFFKDTLPFSIETLIDVSKERKVRTDWYAVPSNPGCGIKTREGWLETKLRLRELGSEKLSLIEGRIEEWAKWRARWENDDLPPEKLLQSNGWITVEKNRYLEVFHVTADGVQKMDFNKTQEWWKLEGCHFEITELMVDSTKWWTAGFEAFGPKERLYNSLKKVVRHVFRNEKQNPGFFVDNSYGYPEFLSTIFPNCFPASM